jgi:hypothetical protein
LPLQIQQPFARRKKHAFGGTAEPGKFLPNFSHCASRLPQTRSGAPCQGQIRQWLQAGFQI